MPSRRLPPAAATLAWSSADEVEAQFYEALRQGDLDRVMACWLEDDDAVCVHPSGQRMLGLTAIRASFDAIFSHGTLQIAVHEARIWRSESASIHHVLERIGTLSDDGAPEGWALATNVYVPTERGWRLVAHHASPVDPGQMRTDPSTPSALRAERNGGGSGLLH